MTLAKASERRVDPRLRLFGLNDGKAELVPHRWEQFGRDPQLSKQRVVCAALERRHLRRSISRQPQPVEELQLVDRARHCSFNGLAHFTLRPPVYEVRNGPSAKPTATAAQTDRFNFVLRDHPKPHRGAHHHAVSRLNDQHALTTDSQQFEQPAVRGATVMQASMDHAPVEAIVGKRQIFGVAMLPTVRRNGASVSGIKICNRCFKQTRRSKHFRVLRPATRDQDRMIGVDMTIRNELPHRIQIGFVHPRNLRPTLALVQSIVGHTPCELALPSISETDMTRCEEIAAELQNPKLSAERRAELEHEQAEKCTPSTDSGGHGPVVPD